MSIHRLPDNREACRSDGLKTNSSLRRPWVKNVNTFCLHIGYCPSSTAALCCTAAHHLTMIALWIPGKAPRFDADLREKSVNVIGVTVSNARLYPVCGSVHVKADRPVSICTRADPPCVTFQYITSLLVARVDFPFLKRNRVGCYPSLIIPIPSSLRPTFPRTTYLSPRNERKSVPGVICPRPFAVHCAFPD